MPANPNSSGHLLQLVRSGRAASRGELQQVTGLARSTVTSRVDALLAAGYLLEDGVLPEFGRGRPATRLRVDADTPTILVADLGATHGRLAVSSAAGDLVAEEVIESAIDRGPAWVLPRVARRFTRMLGASGRSPDSLAGVCIGIPGPVLPDGTVARSISMAGWDHHPVGADMQERFAVPVVVENDANLMGLGEQSASYPEAHLLLFVKVGTGIGAAIVLDGQLVHGRQAAEGDIGHAKLAGVTEVCSCGATGCLAASASGRALVRDLNRQGHQLHTSREVAALARRGNVDAVDAVTRAGRTLGTVLSTVVSLLNPEVVVVGGDLAHAEQQLLPAVRETLLGATQPLATSALTVAPSRLGDRAGITGAARLVRDRIFGVDAVDSALDAVSG